MINKIKATSLLFIVSCLLIYSCKTTYKANPAKAAATRQAVMPSDSIRNIQSVGMDFIAFGNTPGQWRLEMDLEKGFFFKADDSRQLIASPVAANRNANGDTYVSKTDSGNMQITIYNEMCAGTDKMPAKKVEVLINNKKYSGCGSFLYNYLLNDIWVLQLINNKEITAPGHKKQLPILEFNLATNKMLGNDGCNDINADFIVKGNHITFSSFANEKMSCSDNEIIKIFSSLLSGKTVDYSIKDLRLTLFLADDSRLVFKKVD